MSLIEGVGDEVTVGVTVFVLLCLVLLAWFSTHTRDIPFVSIIVVELSQRRNRNRNNGQQASGSGDVSSDTQQTDNGENAPGNASEGDNSVSANNNAQTSSDTDEAAPSSTSKTLLPNSNSTNTVSSQPGALNAETIPDSNASSQPGNGSTNHEAAETQEQPAALAEKDVPSDTSRINAAASMFESGASPEASAKKEVLEVEDSAAEIIPEWSPEIQSSDEMRRRRVAYFESGKDNTVTSVNSTKADTVSNSQTNPQGADAQSEMSSLGAQSEENQPDSDIITESSLDPATPSQQVSRSDRATPSAPEVGGSPLSDGMAASAAGPNEQATASTGSPGETVESDPHQIRVRLKYLNDTQRLVMAHPHETVGDFRRQHFSSELEDNKTVRFIFNGQDLRNDLSTLGAYHILDNSVIHCLITQSRTPEPPAGARRGSQEDDNQLGEFIYPLFGLILGLVWYLRFAYKQYFNAMSTVSLAGVSFIYALALFSSIRHRRQPHQHLD